MENKANPKVVLTLAAVTFVCVFVWQTNFYSHKNQLGEIVEALDIASQNQDKFAAAEQFEKLAKLKYKYADEKNISCLNAVMTLEGVADEVNATGSWNNKQETVSAIKACES